MSRMSEKYYIRIKIEKCTNIGISRIFLNRNKFMIFAFHKIQDANAKKH